MVRLDAGDAWTAPEDAELRFDGTEVADLKVVIGADVIDDFSVWVFFGFDLPDECAAALWRKGVDVELAICFAAILL